MPHFVPRKLPRGDVWKWPRLRLRPRAQQSSVYLHEECVNRLVFKYIVCTYAPESHVYKYASESHVYTYAPE